MKVQVYKLKGKALDYAVGLAVFKTFNASVTYQSFLSSTGEVDLGVYEEDLKVIQELKSNYSPTTNWAQAGKIIETKQITIGADGEGWCAGLPWDSDWMNSFIQRGPTPLVAAMRTFVELELGDEIEIPDEYLEPEETQA